MPNPSPNFYLADDGEKSYLEASVCVQICILETFDHAVPFVARLEASFDGASACCVDKCSFRSKEQATAWTVPTMLAAVHRAWAMEAESLRRRLGEEGAASDMNRRYGSRSRNVAWRFVFFPLAGECEEDWGDFLMEVV